MPQPIKLFCVSCLRDTQHMPGGSPMVMSCDCGQVHVDQSKEKDIHRRLSDIVMVAKHEAKEHNCNYNIIVVNPVNNMEIVNGRIGPGATYEFVADSYFNKERPNARLLATTLQLGVIIYDKWLKYTEYEKQECDIKLHDGTIICHCYPNAGSFSTMCADNIEDTPEDQVAEIMYKKYYLDDLCKKNKYNCNGLEGEDRLPVAADLGDPTDAFIEHMSNTKPYYDAVDARASMLPNKKAFGRPVAVRTEPKIGRNAPCPCGSGKKYKKCCI
jgi:SEC-C motif